MSQIATFDIRKPLSILFEDLNAQSLAVASNQSGDDAPVIPVAHGFWADKTLRAMRQYCFDTDDGARALWTLESGPYAIIPRNVTGNVTMNDAIAGAGIFHTWTQNNTTGGAHTVTLPLSANAPNSILGHVLTAGANPATIACQGGDLLRDPSGAGTSSSIALQSVGDQVVLYTVGDGFWRVLDERVAGLISKTGAYSMGPWDGGVLADATGGGFTVTLPDPARALGRTRAVARMNAGGGAVTVATAAGTISGAATDVLGAQYVVGKYLATAGSWLKL